MGVGSNNMSGNFTSDGTNQLISIPIGADTMYVTNYTRSEGAQTAAFKFYWQRGMADLGGVRYHKEGAANEVSCDNNDAADPGFSLVNTSDQTIGAPSAVTAVSDAATFVVSAASTTGLGTDRGDIVRLTGIATEFNTRGFDFEVGTVIDNTSFENRWALANTPGGAGGAGFYRRVLFDPIFYPRWRNIVDITGGATTLVTTSIAHGYLVGQTVRFTLPAGWGMVELNGLSGTISAVSTANNTFTVKIDSSGFTAFTWIASQASFEFATVAPAKMDTAQALASGVDVYSDARENRAVQGLLLYAGAQSPAGQNNDEIYWAASSSEVVNNLI